MKRKLTLLMMSLAVTVCCFAAKTTVKADEVEAITPNYVSDWNEYNATAQYQTEWTSVDLQTMDQADTKVIKLDVKTDSIVLFDFVANTNDPVSHGYDFADMEVYRNRLLTDEYKSLSYDVGDTSSNMVTTQNMLTMPKGEYYVRLKVTHGNGNVYKIVTKMGVSAFEQKKMFSVTSKKVKNEYKITTINKYDNESVSEFPNIFYCKGNWKIGKSACDLEEYKGNGDISVDRPGAYTIVFARTNDKYHIHAFDSVVVHHVVKDETKPVVKGVANGKTYKKAVTIKFSDIDSGIKSAKLNGKSIKSGKKITKSGNYTLVVIDKAGNKVTIKFKVKINKK